MCGPSAQPPPPPGPQAAQHHGAGAKPTASRYLPGQPSLPRAPLPAPQLGPLLCSVGFSGSPQGPSSLPLTTHTPRPSREATATRQTHGLRHQHREEPRAPRWPRVSAHTSPPPVEDDEPASVPGPRPQPSVPGLRPGLRPSPPSASALGGGLVSVLRGPSASPAEHRAHSDGFCPFPCNPHPSQTRLNCRLGREGRKREHSPSRERPCRPPTRDAASGRGAPDPSAP